MSGIMCQVGYSHHWDCHPCHCEPKAEIATSLSLLAMTEKAIKTAYRQAISIHHPLLSLLYKGGLTGYLAGVIILLGGQSTKNIKEVN